MTSNDRIKLLEKYILDNPDDPFNKYALALEYITKEPQKCEPLFEELLTKFPDYLPTYYQAMKFYAENNQMGLADKVYETGVQKAMEQADHHALKELKSAYLNYTLED